MKEPTRCPPFSSAARRPRPSSEPPETQAMNIAVKVAPAETAAEVAATPLEKLNPARVDRFYNDTIWPVFERLRREDPVHFTPDSEYGPYWSVTKWNDIMAVDTNHEAFSSADGIGLANLEAVAEQEKVMGV